MSDSGYEGRGNARRARALRRVALIPLVYLAASAACSSGSRPREIGKQPDVSGLGNPDAGGTPNVPHTNLPDGGELSPDAGGLEGDAGASLEPPICGNGAIDPGEDCDPALAVSESCVLRGFDTGVLGCDEECHFTTAQCSGVETCSDGRDNDGDGSLDCADADCAVPCTDACFAPPVVAVNSTVYGSTSGHGATLAASCGDGTSAGREVVYQVTVTEDAKLDVVDLGRDDEAEREQRAERHRDHHEDGERVAKRRAHLAQHEGAQPLAAQSQAVHARRALRDHGWTSADSVWACANSSPSASGSAARARPSAIKIGRAHV